MTHSFAPVGTVSYPSGHLLVTEILDIKDKAVEVEFMSGKHWDKTGNYAIANGKVCLRVPTTEATVLASHKEGRCMGLMVSFTGADCRKDSKRVNGGRIAIETAQMIFADLGLVIEKYEDAHFEDVRIYRHKETGRTLQYMVDFPNYAVPMRKEGGLTMNELNATGEWEQIPYTPSNPEAFDYNTISHTTIEHGEAVMLGQAAVCRTGWGDGYYPVSIYLQDGKVVGVSANFS